MTHHKLMTQFIWLRHLIESIYYSRAKSMALWYAGKSHATMHFRHVKICSYNQSSKKKKQIKKTKKSFRQEFGVWSLEFGDESPHKSWNISNMPQNLTSTFIGIGKQSGKTSNGIHESELFQRIPTLPNDSNNLSTRHFGLSMPIRGGTPMTRIRILLSSTQLQWGGTSTTIHTTAFEHDSKSKPVRSIIVA